MAKRVVVLRMCSEMSLNTMTKITVLLRTTKYANIQQNGKTGRAKLSTTHITSSCASYTNIGKKLVIHQSFCH